MFPVRRWNIDGVKTLIKTLIKKIDLTVSIDRQRGSGRPRSARMPANVNEVDGLALSQEGKLQTTSPTLSMTFRRIIVVISFLFVRRCLWFIPIGVGDGGLGGAVAPQIREKHFSGKIFFGKNHVKFGHFVNFFWHISCKIPDFVNFRANIM